MDASVYVNAWWNGAALDRLIDARHAQVVDAVVPILAAEHWQPITEFTFAEFSERGSIDVFAGHDVSHSVFVGEAKTEWGSIEETLRRLHIKARLAPKLGRDAFGWQPTAVGAALIFPEDRTARRVAQRFAATLDASLPAHSRDVRRWIHEPSGSIRGVWFLTDASYARISRK